MPAAKQRPSHSVPKFSTSHLRRSACSMLWLAPRPSARIPNGPGHKLFLFDVRCGDDDLMPLGRFIRDNPLKFSGCLALNLEAASCNKFLNIWPHSNLGQIGVDL